MVKNKKGGNKGKRGARRHYNQSDRSNKIRFKMCKDETYARILNMYGNGASVLCEDNITRFLVWRKKFKGRNKRDNDIKINGVVLVGLRSWEVVAPGKKSKADLLFVYSKEHMSELYKKKDIARRIFPDGIKCDMAIQKHGENTTIELEEEPAEKLSSPTTKITSENKVIMHDISLKEMLDDI